VVRVRDTGVGISAEVLPRIFDLFVQVDSSLERAQGGLGLGLTLVRTLVELHGGSVRAESAGIGTGTELSVELPLVTRAAVGAAPGGRPANGNALARAVAPARVVVVEDSADLRQSLQDVLVDAGCDVSVAVDGLDGLERILELCPQLAIVDVGLPGIDGYELARRVRAALGRGILLVALTGYGAAADRTRSLAAGFDVHLTKPVTCEQLYALLGHGALPGRMEAASTDPDRP
jgi:CheY-like chemotaxis protein